MRKFFAVRAVFAALTCGTLVAESSLAASNAQAASVLGLSVPGELGGPQQAVEGLPPPTGPGRPVRQFVFGDCATSAAPNCRFTFFQVPANRHLRIESISCFATSTGGQTRHFILTNNAQISTIVTSAKAIITPTELQDLGSGTIGVFAAGNGPYFFQAGERAFLFGPGGSGGGCGISGYLFPTN